MFRRMDHLDTVKLAEAFNDAPMDAQSDDLVEAQHVATVLDVVHLDLNRGAATAGRRRINIAHYGARINDQLVSVLETD